LGATGWQGQAGIIMATGLIALLDDVAAIAKVAAASIDDVAAQAVKAGTKAAGVVIDDTAVTPRYVVGFAAARELPIIGRIALGSLRNKLLYLLPAALLLSAFAPWAITPLLVLGGAYLCFEGAEKVLHLLAPHHDDHAVAETGARTPEELEEEKVSGAIRTDFILSAEIMAIALATVESPSIVVRGAVLAAVGILVTLGVYGMVALLVKADDAGAALARRARTAAGRGFGRGLVHAMPPVLSLLSLVGTVAMLWVGGQIILHGLADWGWHAPEDIVHRIRHGAEVAVHGLGRWAELTLGWIAQALAAAVAGLGIGLVIVAAVTLVRPRAAAH
jgi:predicted DNA repair protein MutK